MIKADLYHLALFAGCAVALLAQSQAHAEAVYTWVDNLGVTHFSETPPPEPGIKPAMIEVKPLPPVPPSEYDDYYSVIRQADRMERRRLEKEKLEAERVQADAEAARARAEADAAMQSPNSYAGDTPVYAPVYPYYPYYRPGYGGKPWPPGHWPGQPGHSPGMPGFRPMPRRVISAIPAQH
jgi:hypothetical protein